MELLTGTVPVNKHITMQHAWAKKKSKKSKKKSKAKTQKWSDREKPASVQAMLADISVENCVRF